MMEEESPTESESSSSESSSGYDGSENERKKRQQGRKRKMTKRKYSRQSLEKLMEKKSHLPVTCGHKGGYLYLEKYSNNEKCILSEGQWFYPSEFEKFGGKEKHKKWKTTIYYRDVPLQKLIEDKCISSPVKKKSRIQHEESESRESSPVAGRLRTTKSESRESSPVAGRLRTTKSESRESSPVAGRLRTTKARRKLFPSNSESEGIDSVLNENNNNSDDVVIYITKIQGPTLPVTCSSLTGVHKDRFAKGSEGRESVHYEDNDNNDDNSSEDDEINITIFKGPTLPLTCGSVTGILHKYRFAKEDRGKCIRTEDSWLTPEDFFKLGKQDGTWEEDIVAHEIPLRKLIKKEILRIHPLFCKCKKCSDQECDLSKQRNDDVCYECGFGGNLVCCDECPRAFHSHCHLPALNEDSTGEWMCTFCVLRTNQQWFDSSHITEEKALNLPVSSHYTMYCDYLLLYMYSEDAQDVFVKDPRKTVRRYAEFITHPMWLERIKLKLEAKEYQTVGDFVSDIRLIFSNCRTFNRDNEFGRMGARLKDLFDREFKKVFSIQ